MKPVIEIIVVGNEIISGKTADINAPYMRNSLADAGFTVNFISFVSDVVREISEAIHNAVSRAHIVLVSGGLGPTSDDVTIEAAAEAFGVKLIPDKQVLKRIEQMFKRRNRFMSESNKKQALIPENAEAIMNPAGTAPGVCMKVPSGQHSMKCGSMAYFMPGVPVEMQRMFDEVILPRIKGSFEPSPVQTASVSVTGISESELYDTIGHLSGAGEAFAYYPGYSGIEIIIRTGEQSPLSASELRDEVIEILGDRVFSTSGESIEQVIGEKFIEQGLTVGIAESCTGGLIAHRLTNIPGSSAFFLGGVVAYSNESKTAILGVNPALIKTYGAVSAEVAAAMAEGMRRITCSDIGISTTGIAGPGGGSPEKPVGLMYMGISSEQGTNTKKLLFAGDRLINKKRMSQSVLDILRYHLKYRSHYMGIQK